MPRLWLSGSVTVGDWLYPSATWSDGPLGRLTEMPEPKWRSFDISGLKPNVHKVYNARSTVMSLRGISPGQRLGRIYRLPLAAQSRNLSQQTMVGKIPVINTLAELRAWRAVKRERKQEVGVVPTVSYGSDHELMVDGCPTSGTSGPG